MLVFLPRFASLNDLTRPSANVVTVLVLVYKSFNNTNEFMVIQIKPVFVVVAIIVVVVAIIVVVVAIVVFVVVVST